jgi:hypothetical protein
MVRFSALGQGSKGDSTALIQINGEDLFYGLRRPHHLWPATMVRAYLS